MNKINITLNKYVCNKERVKKNEKEKTYWTICSIC